MKPNWNPINYDAVEDACRTMTRDNSTPHMRSIATTMVMASLGYSQADIRDELAREEGR